MTTKPNQSECAAAGVREFTLRHLLAWCGTMERSTDEAEALRDRIVRYLDWATNGGDVDTWAMAESFGWRWAMRRMEDWEAENYRMRERSIRGEPYRAEV